MIRKSNILLPLLFCLLSLSFTGQNAIDSLKKVIASSADTTKARTQIFLAGKYKLTDTANAFPLLDDALAACIKLNYKKGITLAYSAKTRMLLNVYNDSVALKYLGGLLNYIDTTLPNTNYAAYLITLASIYADDGNFERASVGYFNSLKVSDAINDKPGMAKAYHGLGFINMRMNNYDKAEYFCAKALALYKEIKDHVNEAKISGNIGGIYLQRAFKSKSENDYGKAFDYLSQSAEISMSLGDELGAAQVYTNLGALFGSKNEFSKSLLYSRKALQLRNKVGYKYGVASTINNMVDVFLLQKKYDSAEFYNVKALLIGKELHAPLILRSCYEQASILYEGKKDPERSLQYFKLFKSISDSLQDADKTKVLADAQEKYESDKKDKEISLLGKVQEAKDAELSKQRLINYIIAGSLLVVLVLSFFVFKQYAQKKKANGLLKAQNDIINEKNQSITDSINYAKVIQDAILPGEKEFTSKFSDGFVLFRPKDIVSGDFYWISQQGERTFFAVADSTGHGVPGGFMSMLGTSLLNETASEKEPGAILDILRDKIMASLRQQGERSESKDGMDITLCRLDTRSMQLHYACAYNSFFLIRKGQLIESHYNKMPVGFHHNMSNFETFAMPVEKGDILYLLTDGYADQFGGDKKKKLKIKTLKELLLRIHQQPMPQQKEFLSSTISQWMGMMEQTDDICVAGIKI
jgi:serine phosphatase RsbU (regulator of sigma subunit)